MPNLNSFHFTLFFRHTGKNTSKNIFRCNICNKVFLKPSKLRKHFRKHEREQSVAGKSFQCHLCKYQFVRLQGLRIHINIKHVSSIKKKFRCEHCKDVFAQQPALDEHLRKEHQLIVPFKCPHCNRQFQSDQSAELKVHLATHAEDKPFMCEVRI